MLQLSFVVGATNPGNIDVHQRPKDDLAMNFMAYV